MKFCTLILLLYVGCTVVTSAKHAKRDAEPQFDDVWTEEHPVDEVERLMREYKENRELVSSIKTSYYQIIYPVQVRHHEKIGISTREVPTMARPDYGTRSQGYPMKATKHFHRTSLLIKAFSHKFRLDLELNTQLLAPNLLQKHFLPGGPEQISKQDIEHCYYHGEVKDYPGAVAAVRTCNGVSGVIHIGNETFIIHPFYGGDLSRKHPHLIFEARSKIQQKCGNSGMHEWGSRTRANKQYNGGAFRSRVRRYLQNPENSSGEDLPTLDNHNLESILQNLVPERPSGVTDDLPQDRNKRDVRQVTKYVEMALIIDRGMFTKRNGSSKMEVVHDGVQIANIADLYFRTLNTRLSVVYLETWGNKNLADIDGNHDIYNALLNFNDYTSRKLYKVDKDTIQLITGETFRGGETGMAVPGTVCTNKAVGISTDINIFEPHLTASTMAHMIGHNMGMGHDDQRDGCHCLDWHGCIMKRNIVGLESVQPYKFSDCSLNDYIDTLRLGRAICLFNKPNQIPDLESCGNGKVEEGEECDCGMIDTCEKVDPCCDPITCRLKVEAECATGLCCDNCKLLPRGTLCRAGRTECDIPEFCNGQSGHCPLDIHKKNGAQCHNNNGYCFNGECPTRESQCKSIWGYGGQSADEKCFEQFNVQGSMNGNCGQDDKGHYKRCDVPDVLCGSLYCQHGSQIPEVNGMDQMYSRTIISIAGKRFECNVLTLPNRVASGTLDKEEIADMGLVNDGTQCGNNLICVNQSCASIYPYIQTGKCPSNNIAIDCSGNGVCSNINSCYCNQGWSGNDCSERDNTTTPYPRYTTPPPNRTAPSDTQPGPTYSKNTTVNLVDQSGANTVFMVIVLVSCVGGVFIVFALMALCYRRKSSVSKYDPPYPKKPMMTMGPRIGGHPKEDESSFDSNRIITFGSMPSYREHKMHLLKRQGINLQQVPGVPGTAPEEEALQSATSGQQPPNAPPSTPKQQQFSTFTHKPIFIKTTGEDESVSFIEVPPNNLSKIPEKGILKKAPHWSEESQSEYQEGFSSQSDNVEAGAGISDVERTLKQLNGYHEDIIDALRHAANHRGPPGTLGSGSGASASYSDDLGKSLQSSESYHEYPSDFSMLKSCPEKLTVSSGGTVDDGSSDVPPCGPLRIRNLEDLIRQLEAHPGRHMSPSGSEDIRMSETEADRHYRLDSSSCTESQGLPVGDSEWVIQKPWRDEQSTSGESWQGSRQCRAGDDGTGLPGGFVYGRYRHPSTVERTAPSLPGVSDGGESLGEASEPRDTAESESDYSEEFIQQRHLMGYGGM